MNIRFASQILEDIAKRGEIKIPKGHVVGQPHEEYMRRNKESKHEIDMKTEAEALINESFKDSH